MITVKVVGIKPIVDNLNKATQTVERVATNHLRELGPQVVVNVRRHTPEATGKLSNAIEDTVSNERGTTVLTVGANDSVKPVVTASVEGGTKPHWPPWGEGSELAAWAKLKGIPVFLVAKAIALRGTIARFGGPSKGAEMFKKGLEDSERQIAETTSSMEKTLAQEVI